MSNFKAEEHPHVRYNPLKDEWVLISPHRLQRPWQGQEEESSLAENIPKHDSTNPLCPGVIRSSGIYTPNYESTYVFTNDFPALLENVPEPDVPASSEPQDDLFKIGGARGTCRVMCFHPESDVHFPSMSLEEIQGIIEEWKKQITELGQRYQWVQIFENKGQIMGCSNPHPHCQIWASSFMPNEPKIKDKMQKAYYEKHGSRLLDDYVKKELQNGERIVCVNDHWVALVPFWAVWPFETMILPRESIKRFTDVTDEQKQGLAVILKELTIKYDNLFKCSFPYSMGWHGAPTGPALNEAQEHWTFHGIYYPPLLRSATVKKFMVGYELLAQAQRDLTPEKAAEMIKNQPCRPYDNKFQECLTQN